MDGCFVKLLLPFCCRLTACHNFKRKGLTRMKTSFSSAVRTAAISAVAAMTLGLGAGVATAQPAAPDVNELIGNIPGLASIPPTGVKEMVTFGDSFTANAGKGGPRGLEPGQTPFVTNCATDAENWPKIAAGEMGVSLGDWSCNGTGGLPTVQLLAYLEESIRYGDLGEGTKDVVLMYGGMDTLQWVDVAGVMVAQGADQIGSSAFRETMKRFVDRVHEVAPGAKVTLASYPEYATDNQLCLFNMPGQVVPIPAPGGDQVQGALRDSIKNAATYSGAGFVDVYEKTKGHGTCNPNDDERYVAGFLDPAMGPMTNHPTVKGEHAMGHIIADSLRND